MTATWIPFLLMAAMSAAQPRHLRRKPLFLDRGPGRSRCLRERYANRAERVSLLTRVVATEPEPVLDVLSVETLGKELRDQAGVRWRVKLSCHVAGEMLAVLRHREFASFGSRVREPCGALTSTAWSGHSEITMKAGAHATLMIDDQRSHIQVAVISLENGIVGHRIHVASLDHKQTMLEKWSMSVC